MRCRTIVEGSRAKVQEEVLHEASEAGRSRLAQALTAALPPNLKSCETWGGDGSFVQGSEGREVGLQCAWIVEELC